MATRRMVDINLINSDDFILLESAAQSLYLQFIANADDDGFVGNPKAIMRMSEKTKADLTELVKNGFVIPFEKCVVITHWNMHNKIRKDRYNPTRFKDEYNALDLDESGVYHVKENADDTDGGPDAASMPHRDEKPCEDNAPHSGGQSATGEQTTRGIDAASTPHRLGKVRLGKVSIYSADAESCDDGDGKNTDTGTGTGGGQNKRFDYAKYADAWNAAAEKNGMTKVTAPKHWNDARKKALKSLCAKQGDDMVIAVIKKAGESTFLGNSGRKWKATFDWFVKPGNFLKVSEGNYTDTFEKKGKSRNAPPPDDWFTNQTDEMAAESLQEMIAAGQRGAGG